MEYVNFFFQFLNALVSAQFESNFFRVLLRLSRNQFRSFKLCNAMRDRSTCQKLWNLMRINSLMERWNWFSCHISDISNTIWTLTVGRSIVQTIQMCSQSDFYLIIGDKCVRFKHFCQSHPIFACELKALGTQINISNHHFSYLNDNKWKWLPMLHKQSGCKNTVLKLSHWIRKEYVHLVCWWTLKLMILPIRYGDSQFFFLVISCCFFLSF